MIAMLSWLLVLAGAFGLVIGSFLNVVIARVPSGVSLVPRSRCPQCESPIRVLHNVPVLSWILLRGRCASCQARISAQYPLVELVTGITFVLVSVWMINEHGWPGAQFETASWWMVLAAYLGFTAVAIALICIDLKHMRLPDVIVLPSLAAIGLLLALAAALDGEWSRFWTVLFSGALMFILYLAIALVYPKGIGGGDVKLAPLIGIVLGFMGWGALVVGAFAGFALGAVIGLALIVMRRATRKTALPFGPFMLIGAWVGILWGEQIAAAYLALFGLA